MSTPQPGYLLGVDLGTSNTVAVIRWPDGRTRPLLVDGAPVMPSAVFVDESGHIHVGRDAQRLAQTDPGRYEPNPKQRAESASILLGDREVPTVALLAAILRAVADKAVEAIGFLPPAVLTHPAQWGSLRRETLQDAAARAGFPPVLLVPEPIAAARYFAQVMQRPIPVGASVAVFDFGGGTLDIAVVRNDGPRGFTVLGDGGLKDLGGLDVDAALVTHLGRTIEHNAPELWRRLSNPQSTTDKRARRQFADDVRGAKEMLSRTTVAPIPVPGVDHSIHLTRDELERLATPLLERAVAETRRVIEAAHLTPETLPGLFLVGGASRIPLVSRLLHSRLGIAPTVLEQPELPVAEGSLATVRPEQLHEPMSIAMTSPGPVSPGPQPYTPPQGMGGPPPGGFIEPKRVVPLWKRRSVWIASAAAAVVLAIGGWLILRDPYPQEPMHALQQVGGFLPFGTGAGPGSASAVDVEDGVAYHLLATGDGKTAEVVAVNLEDGTEKWRNTTLTSDYDWGGVWAENGIVMIYADTVSDPAKQLVLDAGDGTLKASLDYNTNDNFQIVGDRILRHDAETATTYAYDADGRQKWQIATESPVGEPWLWGMLASPVNTEITESDKVYTVGADGTVAVWNTSDGNMITSAVLVQDPDSAHTFAYEGELFIATGTNGYTLSSYSLDDLSPITTVQLSGAERDPTSFRVCGETRVCVTEESGRITVVDVADGLKELWWSPEGTAVADVVAVGESLAVFWDDEAGQRYTTMYDADFAKVGGDHLGRYFRVDSGSLLLYPTEGSYSQANFSVMGLGAQDGVETGLGAPAVYACGADNRYLSCITDSGHGVWKYRD